MEQAQEVRPEGGLPARLAEARGFFANVQAEMKKVSWPTRDELTKATRMILILSVALGIAIGLLDVLLNFIFVRGVAALAR
jgi:preprotein translocase subunit SecE